MRVQMLPIVKAVLLVVVVLFLVVAIRQALFGQDKNPQKIKMNGDPELHVPEVKLKPALTADQKLEIRTAQVEAFQAKTMLESTPQYKAFVSAQDEMNQVALKVQRDSGCVPPDWQFTQNLECVAVPKPAPEKK